MKKIIFLFSVLAITVFSLTNAKAQTLPGSNIPNGNYLAGSTIINIGGFKLVYQTDGNLVLSSTGSNARALWASGPLRSDAARCVILADIQLFTLSDPQYAYWSTPIFSKCQYSWVLQNDGNLVRYESDCLGHITSISTGTAGGAVSNHFGELL